MMIRLLRINNALLLLAALLFCSDASAQRSKNALNCPAPFRAARVRSSEAVPGSFFELSLGAAYPFRYTNSGGAQTTSSPGFTYKASPYPCLAATFHLIFRDRLTLFTGVDITGNQQGLQYEYSSEGGVLRDTRKNFAHVTRLSLGAGYQLTPRFKIFAGPYIAYSRFHDELASGEVHSGPPAAVQWTAADKKSRFIPGLRLGLQYQLSYRFLANAIFSADLAQSGSTSGIVQTTGRAQEQGISQPYLFYTGLTLGYKLFSQEGD